MKVLISFAFVKTNLINILFFCRCSCIRRKRTWPCSSFELLKLNKTRIFHNLPIGSEFSYIICFWIILELRVTGSHKKCSSNIYRRKFKSYFEKEKRGKNFFFEGHILKWSSFYQRKTTFLKKNIFLVCLNINSSEEHLFVSNKNTAK